MAGKLGASMAAAAAAMLLPPASAQDLFLAARGGGASDEAAPAPPAGRRLQGGGQEGPPLFGGPPERPLDYCGRALPAMTVSGTAPVHVLAIGDWGGLDGSLWEDRPPPNGRHRLITYEGGHTAGPHVFPRSRWNLLHTERLCGHRDFVECFDSRGGATCEAGCGYVDGVDWEPQQLVAEQFKRYAELHRPKYILNVGDNFYWGGIERDCGTPMGEISYEARHQFDQVFEGIYSGPGLDGVPWLSVLGNHDWGGRVFNNGWDQQIAYTWSSPRWVMPAPFFKQRVNYADQGFSVDFLFIDSNAMDAMEPELDPEHNLCSEKYNLNQGLNQQSANCSAVGGPEDVTTCKDWFWGFWQRNKDWAEQELAASDADWQIIVTHFPCGHEMAWYRSLYATKGLDLLVTGHRHDQELWVEGHPRFWELGGLSCIVTGGGGGITSEATPVETDGNWYGEAQYGFYDLVISKSNTTVKSIDYKGDVIMEATILPH